MLLLIYSLFDGNYMMSFDLLLRWQKS